MSKLLMLRGWSLLACGAMVLPQLATAQAPSAATSAAAADVSLHRNGLLIGQVTSRQGRPLPNTVVSLQQAGRELARMRTDYKGQFAVRGLRGGSFQLVTANGVRPIRAWSVGTAPPGARHSVLLVDGLVVRGQSSRWTEYRGAEHVAQAPELLGPDGSTPIEPIPAEGTVPTTTTGVSSPTSYVGTQYGNYGYGGYGYGGVGSGNGTLVGSLMARPWLVGTGIVAAAVAIPVALDDDDAS